MFQITLQTQIKMYISNNFLLTITTIVLMSDNNENLPMIKGFKILTLPFIVKKYTSLIKVRIEGGATLIKILF